MTHIIPMEEMRKCKLLRGCAWVVVGQLDEQPSVEPKVKRAIDFSMRGLMRLVWKLLQPYNVQKLEAGGRRKRGLSLGTLDMSRLGNPQMKSSRPPLSTKGRGRKIRIKDKIQQSTTAGIA